MNISKLIAKFILASFVFSSVQGPILAIGRNNKHTEERLAKTNAARAKNAAQKNVAARKASPSVNKQETPVTTGESTQNGNTGSKAPVAPVNTTSDKNWAVLKGTAAVEQTKVLLNNLLATVKADALSFQGKAVNLYKGSLGSVEFSKEGMLNMVAKVTPESTLGKLGVVAVIVTGGVVLYYLKTKGTPDFVKVVAGKVKDFVTSPIVAKGAAALAAIGLVAATGYAYKTGDVKPLAYTLYPVAGAAAIKLAGYAKNAAKSERVSKVASYVAKPFVAAKNAVVSAKSVIGSGLNSVKNVIGSGLKSARKAASSVPLIGKYVAPVKIAISNIAEKIITDVTSQKDSGHWSSIHTGRSHAKVSRQCNIVWRSRTLDQVNQLSGYDRNHLKVLVEAFYNSQAGNDRQTKAQAIISFLKK